MAGQNDNRSALPIRVALVNDYEIVVKGLQQMLAPFGERVVVVETVAGDTPDGASDVALFDTFAGRRHSLRRVAEMVADRDIGKVVLYTWDAPTGFLDDAVDLDIDIDGIILKSETGEQLVEAIERVHRGEHVGFDMVDNMEGPTVLTEREREVLALIARGTPNREIANELYLSVDTVKTHVRHLFAKLGVSNRTQAALEASRFGVGVPGA